MADGLGRRRRRHLQIYAKPDIELLQHKYRHISGAAPTWIVRETTGRMRPPPRQRPDQPHDTRVDRLELVGTASSRCLARTGYPKRESGVQRQSLADPLFMKIDK
ncbi:hypothetical protein [Burkholderia lata]|uniref:hypothetical protein n=1 Tax=Burkholderia lata (strain ATCC 17760 / DSM 23089 / LMG 22485 / NCIMB 9086 / R18194 / 383) TaxID=482957 RepID=UPI001581E8A2|nr:hypothetical protein [Burkholderia lata]